MTTEKYQIAQTNIRHGLDPEPATDWLGLVLDGLVLICLIVCALLLWEREVLADQRAYIERKAADYERLDRNWIACLNGAKIDLGDGWHLDCGQAAHVKGGR